MAIATAVVGKAAEAMTEQTPKVVPVIVQKLRSKLGQHLPTWRSNGRPVANLNPGL